MRNSVARRRNDSETTNAAVPSSAAAGLNMVRPIAHIVTAVVTASTVATARNATSESEMCNTTQPTTGMPTGR